MWAHRDWIGTVLPAGTRPGRELAAYSQVCTAVEGNTTFYALPSAETVARWGDDTPDDFRFVLKLPKTITHERRLRHAGDELRDFLHRFEPLASRLGPTSIQLPASFGPDDLGVLVAFLDSLPRWSGWAVEVRDPAFHAGGGYERALNDALAERDMNRVMFDSRAVFDGPCVTPEEHEAFRNKPRLAVRAVATSDQPIVRFIGQTDPEANPPYWERWIDPVVRWLAAGRAPIVFLHTPDNRVAPQLCRRFHAEVAARIEGLPPLPDPLPVTTTASLFEPS